MSAPEPVPPRSWRHHRGRVAYLARFDPENHAALAAERASLRRTKVADDVRRAITGMPIEQRIDLALDLLLIVLPERRGA